MSCCRLRAFFEENTRLDESAAGEENCCVAVGGKGGRTGGEEFEAVVALDGRSHVDVGRNGEGHLGVLELYAARRLGVLRSSQAQTAPSVSAATRWTR